MSSGKTQIYIEAAKNAVGQNQSSIILVPEIALTPQLIAEFSQHFDSLIVTHSKMTEAQRHSAWQQALMSREPSVVIGPRSALFLPLKQVGLIVVDECHEPSYKQEQSPRYSALRAASVLAKNHDAKLILGSATPAIADYYVAQKNNVPIVRLLKPAAQLKPVDIKVIDLKKRDSFSRHRFLSNDLLAKIESTLADGHQVLLFHNRRGTAPTTICEHCGWTASCPQCFLPLTLHADTNELRCHLCNFKQRVSPSCPECREPTIIFKGIGTKMIETEVKKLFPKAKVARFDADTSDSQAVHSRYQEIYDGEIDIMIGTQMLAKGLDIPKLVLVGVIQADSGLVLPDFAADERVFQLLYQVIGRAGRGIYPGEIIIQTYHPDHPAIVTAVARDYAAFYSTEVKRREIGQFPPYKYLLKLTCSYKTEATAISASQKLASSLKNAYKNIKVLGPTPAFHERLGGAYRWQLVIKSNIRTTLTQVAKDAPPGWQADLDPINLL